MFRKLFSKSSSPPDSLRGDLSTDSGMLCVWDAEAFKEITDYDSWEKELCEDEDIQRQVDAGHLVPLNLGDGAFAVELRRGSPDSLTDREREYLLVPSQPYALRSSGRVVVSGIEHIGADPRSCLELPLAPGDYTLRIQLIDWTQEPGAQDADGNPTPNALPDMLVFYEKAAATDGPYRRELETFRKEDALR